MLELLKQLIEHAPDIIEKAAQSPLGIFALMILVVGVLAVLFFERAPVRVRVFIFVLIFGGVSAFGVAVVREIPSSPTPALQPPADLSGDWQGQGATDVAEVKEYFEYIPFPPGNMSFSFIVDGNVLRGTLHVGKGSYGKAFGSDYGLLEGRAEGKRLSFVVRSGFTVDGAPKVAIKRFSGDIDGDQIHFIVQEDNGYPPLQFTAVRQATHS